MELNKEDITESQHSTLWRTVFLALVFGALTLVVALSIFFYIRTREPMWDNRSGISRLVVTNRSSPERFGTEVFTMFGSEEITLNGEPINDESTIYIAEGEILVLEMVGVSRDTSTGDLSTYSSKLLVSRKDGNSLTPMDLTGTNLSRYGNRNYPSNWRSCTHYDKSFRNTSGSSWNIREKIRF
jgi:hypothetical protein